MIALPGRALQHVPDQVWASAASMQHLDLSGNALSALPKEALAACTALQVRPADQQTIACYYELSQKKIVEKALAGAKAQFAWKMASFELYALMN